MTSEQRKRIAIMRQEGYGYATIAKTIGLTKDSVKSYCRTHDLAGVKAHSNTRIVANTGFCLQCGKSLYQTPGKKRVKFCSADCRQQWWNTHPERVVRKAIYPFVCSCCGNSFTAYGNTNRRYCCHNCYIVARFKGGKPHD